MSGQSRCCLIVICRSEFKTHPAGLHHNSLSPSLTQLGRESGERAVGETVAVGEREARNNRGKEGPSSSFCALQTL